MGDEIDYSAYDLAPDAGQQPETTPENNPYYYGDAPDLEGMGFAEQVEEGARLAEEFWKTFYSPSVASTEQQAGGQGLRLPGTDVTRGTEAPSKEQGLFEKFFGTAADSAKKSLFEMALAGLGGLAKGRSEREKLAVLKDELELKKKRDERAATSMHNVTVPGLVKQTKPIFSPGVKQSAVSKGA